MKAKEIWYSIPEICDESRYLMRLVGDVDVTRKLEQEDIAEQCANHYWCNHQGYEIRWPQDVNLFAKEDGERLATVNVNMDMSPVFTGKIVDGR
jgi:hypothetical protein